MISTGFFQAPFFPNDELKTLRARLLSDTLNFLLVFGTVMLFGNLADAHIPPAAVATNLAALAFYLGARYTLQHGRIVQTGWAVLAAGYVLITLGILSLGSVRTPATASYLLATILAGLLFQRRGVLAMTSAAAAATAALMYAERSGWISPAYEGVLLTEWLALALTLLLAGIIILSAIRATEEAVQRANRALAERRRALETMLSAESMFRSLVEQSQDGIAIADLHGKVMVWNQAMEAITGQRAADVIGRFAWDVQIESAPPERRTPERRARLQAMIEGMLASPAEVARLAPSETLIQTAGGSVRSVEAAFFPIRIGDENWLASILRDSTERKQAEQRLRESEERFHRMFEGHDAVMLLVDPESGQIIDANQAAGRFYGYPVQALRRMYITEINILPQDEHARERGLAMTGAKNCFVYQHRLANGEVRWVEAHSSPLMIQDQPLLFSVIHDITERQRTAAALQETERRLRLTLAAAHVVAWEVDTQTGQIHNLGPTAELFGVTEAEASAGAMEDWLALIHPPDCALVRAALRAAIEEGCDYNVEYRLALPDGELRWIEATGKRVVDAHTGRVRLLGAARNVSDRKWSEQALYEANEQLLAQVWEVEQLQQALREQAIRDHLSGLYNRWFLDEALSQEFARARRENRPISLIMLDIDHFKDLNDAYGHLVGDEIIAMIAGRLMRACRQGDVVCRYGGEEFVVMLHDVGLEKALERAEQCRQAVQAGLFEVDGLTLRPTLSAGVATYPQHADSPAALMRAADAALYQAKANGRNCSMRYVEMGAPHLRS